MEHTFKEALAYIKENFREYVSEAQEACALENVNKYRCPIDDNITDAISELMGDFTWNNDIDDEDWWQEFAADEEEIYWMLGDLDKEVDEELFEEQSKVFEDSIPYRDSTAFQKAMSYISEHNTSLYWELIHMEYEAMTQ